PRKFLDTFTHLDRLTELNPHKGTALFDGKAVKWNQKGKYWAYNNNYVVDFHKDTHSSADYSPTQPDDDDDTARVADLLQKTEETLTAVAEKLRSPIPTSPSAQETEETSQVPTKAQQEPSQTATPPISSQGKGKQPLSRARASAASTTAATSSSLQTPQYPAVHIATKRTTTPPAAPSTPTPVPAPVPPPRNPAPLPLPTVRMAQNAPSRPIGNPPEPFDGTAAKAQSFWNALHNYYVLNEDTFTTEDKKVASALSYFKIGTRAGDWATERMATALAANPVNYGTWVAFQDAFKQQFIPPQLKVEAISRMHNSPMGNQDFNTWYQLWSSYARETNADEESKMFAFRRNLTQGLNAKLAMITPQPTTLNDL